MIIIYEMYLEEQDIQLLNKICQELDRLQNNVEHYE